jgi:hypothetical protein
MIPGWVRLLHDLEPAQLAFVEIADCAAIRSTSMTTSLHSTLGDLAASFADSILEAIRGTPLEELIQPSGQARRKGRPARASTVTTPALAEKKPPRSSGRLTRRSAEDIAAALGQVVALVKKNKAGLRAEQIRGELGLQPKEMPRILKEGIHAKALKTKGQKRATTYFAT